ncbi:glyoxylase-like metal-dependent hydrolase (beta-lactamase superfamily II) [Clostridium saccharoperbutylacetonicum]|uniref:Zn-dependent hydrolase n=1 Tax=Clostridium saccharoperbutylacetonicum N1-4(HMT) TaxID=931276 RepID=M1MNP2_9CLOT|nr:MBL fold metallo-hydrolase [Clostridium saccharoperbutylacetonicum]AGF59509.1 Zn-dependent hydrolase [Clostridium saccharoperbutylacetonicum N1-4(HMT)]NRT59694.1 glyoxylase-like metal-dependent hydrolase (beta-lactamase superfamily II) [Clostridium saccharoperbutylacetonicum]NSB28887.1 glyoxylase-like metal-dependent hydrolase (beta-lactamase superfamily II) [Clostridium saccharoperbutylacetonicum]NSB42378.1 glyoxylase-like metal-dependent hydrolase (beta-lactamase superfamily II) [Clostridi
MGLRKVTQRVYYLINDRETDRPVLGYIKGDKYALMVDAGNSKKHLEKFNDSIEKLNLRLPDYVAITHWHWDHTYGMHSVTGKTIACEITNEQLKVMSKWKWTDDAMKKRLLTGEDIEFADTNIRKEYENLNDINVVPADIVFKNNLEVELGGLKVILKNVVSPHSKDSVIVYIPEERVVFIGDAYGMDYYNNCEYNAVKLESLINMLGGLEFDVCFPGHSSPINKTEIIEYLKSQYNKISVGNE